MLALHKTQSSQFCRDIFRSGKGYDISKNNFHVAMNLLREGYDQKKIEGGFHRLKFFQDFIKKHKLRIIDFYIGFDEQTEKYCFSYNIESKIHNNNPFNCRGIFEESSILFVFYPQMFANYFCEIIDNMPFDELERMAEGN